MRKGISLVGFRSADEVRAYLDACPDALFELSYNMDSAFLEALDPMIRGRVISLHACVPQTACFPNFGSSDPDVIMESSRDLRRTAECALRYGADIIVLHPGYSTDSRVSSLYSERKRLLDAPDFREFEGRTEGHIASPDLLGNKRYRKHFSAMCRNIYEEAEFLKGYGIRLALENLNPRAGYLNMHPQEMMDLPDNSYSCLDIGHLWISHFVFGFDFLEAVRYQIASSRVITMHLHSNPSDGVILEDTHDSLGKGGLPIADVLSIARGKDINLVLETVHDPIWNTELLEDMI